MMMELVYIVLSDVIITTHICLLSTLSVASMTEDLNFNWLFCKQGKPVSMNTLLSFTYISSPYPHPFSQGSKHSPRATLFVENMFKCPHGWPACSNQLRKFLLHSLKKSLLFHCLLVEVLYSSYTRTGVSHHLPS